MTTNINQDLKQRSDHARRMLAQALTELTALGEVKWKRDYELGFAAVSVKLFLDALRMEWSQTWEQLHWGITLVGDGDGLMVTDGSLLAKAIHTHDPKLIEWFATKATYGGTDFGKERGPVTPR